MEQKSPKNAEKFICESCDFSSIKKSNYDKHVLTRKHINRTSSNKNQATILKCENCDKIYKARNSLWYHKKTCRPTPQPLNNNKQHIDSDLVLKILEENKELRKMMNELIPKVGNNNNNNNFNLNIFLNEQCKDAINWDEFIKSIEVGMSDMDRTIESDITKGVANVICKGINKLGVYQRPIHCLDVKRKKLCIKNEDVWEKDSEKIDTTIDSGNRKIQQEHVKFIQEWQEQHPGWEKNSKMVEIYTIMVSKLMRDVELDKCVTEISKNTIIPKDIIEE